MNLRVTGCWETRGQFVCSRVLNRFTCVGPTTSLSFPVQIQLLLLSLPFPFLPLPFSSLDPAGGTRPARGWVEEARRLRGAAGRCAAGGVALRGPGGAARWGGAAPAPWRDAGGGGNSRFDFFFFFCCNFLQKFFHSNSSLVFDANFFLQIFSLSNFYT